MRKHRTLALGASLLALALIAAACSSSGGGSSTSPSAGSSSKPTIVVGVSGNFAENQLVAEMYAQVLEHAGYTVKREEDILTRDVGNKALADGDIDLKPEYTGFDLPLYNKNGVTNGPPAKVAAALKAAVAPHGLVTYAFSPANSTNVFVVLPSTASKYHLTDLSSLASVAGQLTLGAPSDCPTAAFCVPGLKSTYGITFKDVRSISSTTNTAVALQGGAIDVGELFSLDPTITQDHFTVLTDNKNLQADGNFIPVVRKQVATPALGALLDSVTTTLTNDNMLAMVDKVQNQHQDVSAVAQAYLQQQGLI
jgi:osmoprotectant transport system substrate-binding protein